MIAELIEAALRSLLVALAVGSGLLVFRVRNVLAQKAAWGLVLVAAVLMPLLLPVAARWQFVPANARFVLPANPQTLLEELQARIQSRSAAARPATRRPSPPVAAAPQADSPQSEEPAAPARDASSSDRSPATAESSPLSVAPVQSPVQSAAPLLPPAPNRPFPLASALWLVYLFVAAAFLLRLCCGLGTALRIWHGATPVSIDRDSPLAAGLHLRSSRAVSSPVTIGSAVVLPANYATWDSEKLRIVMAHERSHIRQGDFYLQLLTGLYAALFWFSPLGWWLKQKLSDLAEAISDRAGLEQAASRSSYAQVLLEFAAAPRPTLIGVAMARSGRLTHRIERLLNDTSFRHAFASNRLRALLAVLLVPAALFAATALIRVEAASQPQQQPQPPSQPAPAAAPTPAAPSAPVAEPAPAPQAQPPAAGVAQPEPAPEADQDMPSPPAVVVAPIAPGDVPPLPRVEIMPPLTVVAPFPPMSMVLQVPSFDHRAFIIARAQQDADGKGFSFHYSNNGESYAVIAGDDRAHMTFSGDIHTSEIDKARKQAHGDFLWFTHDGKSYFVDDPATVERIQSFYQPLQALGKQQEELGRQQEVLGKQQEAMGRTQEQAQLIAPDISKEMAELSESMAKLQAKIGKTVSREELAKLQGELGELQGKLGEAQGEMGGKQGEFGARMGKLGAMQGELGAKQGKLGAEQGRLAAEADQKVKSIIDQSLKDGAAHPVQ